MFLWPTIHLLLIVEVLVTISRLTIINQLKIFSAKRALSFIIKIVVAIVALDIAIAWLLSNARPTDVKGFIAIEVVHSASFVTLTVAERLLAGHSITNTAQESVVMKVLK